MLQTLCNYACCNINDAHRTDIMIIIRLIIITNIACSDWQVANGDAQENGPRRQDTSFIGSSNHESL